MNAPFYPKSPHGRSVPPDPAALSRLDATLERFFYQHAPAPDSSGPTLVVAFSGGPDSMALLLGLSRRRGLCDPAGELVAAHLDHGLDPGSARRAERAADLARDLGVRTIVEHRPVDRLLRSGESLETGARRVRYGFLEEVRLAEEARWIATAHHRDDQAETVLLRWLYGSGLEGLAAMRPVRGSLIRPLLGLGRDELAAAVREAGIDPLDDPTNRDSSPARNRVRHALMPALEETFRAEAVETGARAVPPSQRLARLAAAAAGARDRVESTLETLLGPRPAPDGGPGLAVSLAALRSMPEALHPHALSFLHRRAGAPYPAGAAARRELARQLADRVGAGVERVGCDCGGGWRWEEIADRLVLRNVAGDEPRRSPEPGDSPRPLLFSYTLRVPGEVEIPELGLRMRVKRAPVADWMFRGSVRRAALALPFDTRSDFETTRDLPRMVIRPRRPGDRIHPLGAPGTRKLKDLLIDRRVPRSRRDRIPLLCLGDRITWVPGVTVDEAHRVPPDAEWAWVAEVVQ